MQIKNYFMIIILIISLEAMIGEADDKSGNSSGISRDYASPPEIIINTSSTEPLKLNNGYELAVKSVDIDGNKVYVELLKGGRVVASKVIIAANEINGTFIYSRPGTPQAIRVHFKNAFRGADRNLVTVDSVWQTSEIYPNRILISDSRPLTISAGTPLKLEEGYELALASVDIDGNKAYLELLKDGQAVDSQVIIAANEMDDTFHYPEPGTSHIIKVHFKNAFRGADRNLVTVGNVWQASETNPNLILINDTQSLTVTSGTPLKLEEGYELVVGSVDIDGNKIYVELFKDGQPISGKVILPANEVDDTFIYSKPGTSQAIEVHFRSAFRGADRNLATIDRISQ